MLFMSAACGLCFLRSMAAKNCASEGYTQLALPSSSEPLGIEDTSRSREREEVEGEGEENRRLHVEAEEKEEEEEEWSTGHVSGFFSVEEAPWSTGQPDMDGDCSEKPEWTRCRRLLAKFGW